MFPNHLNKKFVSFTHATIFDRQLLDTLTADIIFKRMKRYSNISFKVKRSKDKALKDLKIIKRIKKYSYISFNVKR